MEVTANIKFAHLASRFNSALASVRAAEALYDRADRPEVDAAKALGSALETANAAAEAVLAQPATDLPGLKLKNEALLFRWRSSDFDQNAIVEGADLNEYFGERALAAFADLAADIQAMTA